ncbi:MAG TPA: NAD-dependent epimerase/dehydratase family protein [Bacteroidales bacterium]|nr:NAD-dependent epimerase/dehydratase family protein [Bacteroidales bacterium]
MSKRIIVTGGAGFIGSNLCDYLLNNGNEVICIDNFDDYYNPQIKRHNIQKALSHPKYTLIEEDIKNVNKIAKQLDGNFDAIIHLAAKAGVRYSLKYPVGYEESNVVGTKNILNLAVKQGINQFIFASSSSIYGNAPTPFDENFTNLKPINPYAQTKLLSEQIGKEYSEKYNLRFISLRFFSVYGPRLRPDLVMNKIANSIFKNEKLRIFGDGSTARDYTYVDDIILGIMKAVDYKDSKFDIFNLGNGNPIKLTEIITIFEQQIKQNVNIEFVDSIKGESDITWADNSKAKKFLAFTPIVDISNGVNKYLKWYREGLK